MLSSQKGDLAEVRACIEEDTTCIDMQNGWRKATAMMYAVIYGHSQIVELLLEKGASLDIQDNYGRTVLIRAVVQGHSPIVELLLEKGASPDIQDEYGMTALMRSVVLRHSRIVELLIEKGASLDIKDGYDGGTALMRAVIQGHSPIVELLIEKGASLDIQDGDGMTALTISQEKGNEEIVEYIMKKKVLNAEGRLVLAQAIKQGFKGLPYELGLYDQIQSHL